MRYFLLVLFIIFLIAFAISLNASHAITSDNSVDINNVNSCQLTVGWSEWPPYQMTSSTQSRKPVGMQIDLFEQISHLTNCQVSYQNMAFSEILEGLRNGTVDLTLDTTVTSQRERYANFSVPYRDEVLVLYIRPKLDISCRKNTLSELIEKGLRIGLTKGLDFGDKIKQVENDPNLNSKIIYLKDWQANYQAYQNNTLDGFIEDPIVMAYNVRHQADLFKLKACQVIVKGSPVHIMFSKKSVPIKVIERYNRAIRSIKNTRTYKDNWIWSGQ